MAHPRLVILGYSEAAMFLRSAQARDVCAIISIHGRHEFGVEADVRRRLDLTFDEVEVTIRDDVSSIEREVRRKKWSEQTGRIEIAPTKANAAAIIKFAKEIRDIDDGVVLCHCGAGVSRSVAAGLICLAVWTGRGAEVQCVDELLRIRSCAVPHAGLIRFADELLDRNGRLCDALAGGRQA